MKNYHSMLKVKISDEVKIHINIEHSIEMAITHAIQYGMQYASDFVKFLNARSAENEHYHDVDFVSESLDNLAEFNVGVAFVEFESNPNLEKHIQNLKNAVNI